MADWDKVALMHCLVGYEAEILGIITYSTYYSWDDWTSKWSDPVQGLLIVAFCLYTFAGVMLASSKMSGASSTHIVISILSMICMFVTGVFLVIGVGLYDMKNVFLPYSATLMMSAAFLAFMTLIFLGVHLCTGGSRSISNGPNSSA